MERSWGGRLVECAGTKLHWGQTEAPDFRFSHPCFSFSLMRVLLLAWLVAASAAPSKPESEEEVKVEISRCCAIAAVLAMIVAPLVIVPFAIPYVLGLLGFAAVGVTAGSWAALWQATFGIGMMFSILQGLAMGGAGVITIIVSGAAGAAAVTYFCDTVRSSGACNVLDNVSTESLKTLMEKGWAILNATKTMFS